MKWKWCKRNWALMLVVLFLAGAGLLFGILGERSHIAVHDNLDLFQAQYQMMKNTGTFFSHGVTVPFLGGITRDNLPSELSLGGILYAIFPSFVAYVVQYLCKIALATFSFYLLAKELFDRKKQAAPTSLMILGGFLYGILNMFPAFGVSFATIPLVIFLFLRIDRSKGKETALWAALLFVYPFVSYFSYFGLFICCYALVALIALSIVRKKPAIKVFLGLVAVSLGYVVFEYRLFASMLFSDTVTIRSTFVAGDYTAAEIYRDVFDVFVNGMMHAESMQKYVMLPVCVLYFLYLNGKHLVRKEPLKIFKEGYNLGALIMVFNLTIYGLYHLAPFRNFIETIVPPLKGWQFNRTIFFNPFLWVAGFFYVLWKLYQSPCVKGKPLGKIAAYALLFLQIGIVLLSPTRYNDLYHTAHDEAVQIVKGHPVDDLSYGEFYSTELFDEIKEDLSYDEEEWAVAYGFHPAVLEYNGISTLDGYLGFYSQQYKEDFRKIIAPALARMPQTAVYYDEWGARCYLYSGSEDTIVQAVRNYHPADNNIYIDAKALKDLGGKYVFSRIELENAIEAGLTLKQIYVSETSPYAIYVYVIS